MKYLLLFLIIGAALGSNCHAQLKNGFDSTCHFKLYDLIIQRLELMPYVAAAKKEMNLPVTDPAREREVIGQFMISAASKGVEAKAAAFFMQWQIHLASNIQQKLLKEWSSGGALSQSFNKKLVHIRLELDAISLQFIECFYVCAPEFAKGQFIEPSKYQKAKLKKLILRKSDRKELYKRLYAQRLSVL